MEVQRVMQLDGKQLDDEVENLMLLQTKKMFSFFPSQQYRKWKAEIRLILRLILYRISFWSYHTTYGNRLQNLHYRNEKFHELSKEKKQSLKNIKTSPLSQENSASITTKQKILFGIISIGGRYLIDKLEQQSEKGEWSNYSETTWQYKTWKFLQLIEKLFILLDIFQFLLFLYTSKYTTILHALLKLRLVYTSERNMPHRQLSFELMNRQLVWQDISDFMLFIFPLINFTYFKNLFNRMKWKFQSNSSQAFSQSKFDEICPICLSSPINTKYLTNCNHSYCYYCLRTSLLENSNFLCVRCGQQVNKIHRFV